MSTPNTIASPRDPTRERLKEAALRLFSERGIDGVSVRDIVAAAGARNGASLHYYFGTKEALIRELVVDGARRIDTRRNAALDALESRGASPTLAQVARILVETSIEPEGADARPDKPSAGYLRFIGALQANHRSLFMDALENRWNSGYLRCLRHLARLLPLPATLLNQRLIFMSLYLGATLAAREAAADQPGASSKLWKTRWALDNLVDSLCGMLSAPPSELTESKLRAPRPRAVPRHRDR